MTGMIVYADGKVIFIRSRAIYARILPFFVINTEVFGGNLQNDTFSWSLVQVVLYVEVGFRLHGSNKIFIV